MSKTAKILEMKVLGFSPEHIATHLGISREQVNEVVLKNTRPPKTKTTSSKEEQKNRRNRNDQPAMRLNVTVNPLITPHPVPEIKPGIYLLTAEDLIGFASHFQENHISPTEQDSFLDYVRKEIFLEQYGMSEKTLQRHQKDGLLKVYRLGNKLYLKKSQVVAALEKGQL